MAKKTRVNLAARYLDVLSEEGYRPKLETTDDNHAVIVFNSERESFLLFVDEDDESFFHLGSGYELGELDIPAALNRANELNEQLKVVKVTVAPEERAVRFHLESFLGEAPPKMDHVKRAVSAVRNAAAKFFEPIRPAVHLDA